MADSGNLGGLILILLILLLIYLATRRENKTKRSSKQGTVSVMAVA